MTAREILDTFSSVLQKKSYLDVMERSIWFGDHDNHSLTTQHFAKAPVEMWLAKGSLATKTRGPATKLDQRQDYLIEGNIFQDAFLLQPKDVIEPTKDERRQPKIWASFSQQSRKHEILHWSLMVDIAISVRVEIDNWLVVLVAGSRFGLVRECIIEGEDTILVLVVMSRLMLMMLFVFDVQSVDGLHFANGKDIQVGVGLVNFAGAYLVVGKLDLMLKPPRCVFAPQQNTAVLSK
ncbi:hypothetical protein Nepgr_023111 [Nepenthes gracilis]|uniref:Uncharacterized protein n=1 Tax=Nepenthes gracilis TaxID=150966 RepID=A0AAD3XYQ9_NEPGR|nr:hypothetical protein Nepgr_023111 [Nepenthes gracilis]